MILKRLTRSGALALSLSLTLISTAPGPWSFASASPVTLVAAEEPEDTVPTQTESDPGAAWVSMLENMLDLGNYQGALDECNKAIALNPKDSVAFYYRSIAQFCMHVNLNIVLTDLDKAIEINPQYTDALLARAYVHERLNDFQAAINDYSLILSFDPKNEDAVYGRMDMHFALGDIKGLVSDFTCLIAINPDDANSYYDRAVCYKILGQTELAIQDFKKASEIYLAQNNPDAVRDANLQIAVLEGTATATTG